MTPRAVQNIRSYRCDEGCSRVYAVDAGDRDLAAPPTGVSTPSLDSDAEVIVGNDLLGP
ncbi:hypothetical protein [Nocardioides sp. WS12]|uniref:hypothetical protein n=1 Tax=Nocardioides sp. WS12 TaxID=2486272 RepID=UPI0015FBB009|nr:hypothetical protein [Nocardioides sp. WS12]